MRKIIANRKINYEKIMITQNINVLFRCDNEPLLYWGQTERGTLVIGTTVDQDTDLGINRHIHIKVSRPELKRFLKGWVTLYDLFRDYCRKIYVFDFIFNDETLRREAYECDFNGIPDDYIPNVDSYCPENLDESKNEVTFVDISKTIEFSELLNLAAMTSYREINKLPQEKKKTAQKMLKIGRKLKYEHAVYCAKYNIKQEG